MKPKQNPDTTIEQVADELLVLDRARDQLHRLNVTASWVFSRCDGKTTTAQLLDGLMAQFDVDRATAERDIAAMLLQLESLGLIDQGP